MPRVKADTARKGNKRGRKEPQIVENASAASEESFEIPNSADSGSIQSGMNQDMEEAYDKNFSEEMSKLLQRFSTDMNKTMQAKRKKLEQFAQESTRSTARKVLEANKNEAIERQKILDVFKIQFFNMVQQGENELEKTKEAEEKLQKLLVQQQKQQQQARIAHTQRIKALKKLSEDFCKGMVQLEENSVENFAAVYEEMRKEMALLQKKMLLETQQNEMMNVRKHLKHMFA